MTKAQEWFDEGNWAEGLNLQLHPSVNVEEFYKQYHANSELWKKAFQFMQTDLKALEVGKYPLVDGKLIANIQEYNSKEPENARWEAHENFIDVQYVISGKERMGIMPLSDAKNAGTYNAEKDVIFYGENTGAIYPANSETYFLFFPSDLHRPCIKDDVSESVKKLVIKIAAV
ncbi:MAG: YhcH/YjgK/YiaL family protein [Mangrovibacterium sp.]